MLKFKHVILKNVNKFKMLFLGYKKNENIFFLRLEMRENQSKIFNTFSAGENVYFLFIFNQMCKI